MKTLITGRKIELEDKFRERAELKLEKIGKYLCDDADGQVNVSEAPKSFKKVEITVKSQGLVFRAEDTGADEYTVLDKLDNIIIRQIRKNKTKLARRVKEILPEIEPAATPVADYADNGEDFTVIKRKMFDIKPMTVQEAILQMDISQHKFYLFENIDTGKMSVVYVRGESGYGLIEPD